MNFSNKTNDIIKTNFVVLDDNGKVFNDLNGKPFLYSSKQSAAYNGKKLNGRFIHKAFLSSRGKVVLAGTGKMIEIKNKK